MADLSVTVANVVPVSGYSRDIGIAGATITAGQPVYSDSADSNKLKPADANASALTAAAVGIALHGALAGQPLVYITSGSYNPGATVAVGTTYVVSVNAGGIAPISDLASGSWVVHLGYATATNNLVVGIRNLGVQVP